MTLTVDNVDDLEALLAELEAEDPPSTGPVIDDDVETAVIVSEVSAREETPAVAERKPRPPRKMKNLPPVIDHDAVAQAALDAELDGLNELDDLESSAPLDPTTASGVESEMNQDDVQKDIEHLGVATADEVLAEAREAVTEPVAEVDDIDALLNEVDAAKAPTEAPEPIAIAVAPTATANTGAASGGTKLPHISVAPTFNATGSLKTFLDIDKLDSDLNFTTTNISIAMTRQAALFAHYSNLAAQATYQADRAKQQVKLVEAELDQTFRDSMTTAGQKFTEKVIEAMITKDGSYQAAQTRAHEAKAIASMVESAADSFRHRKDMLIQVGADLRQEKQGSPVVREHPGEAAVRKMQGGE